MRNAIVIGSHPNSPWLHDCLASMPTGYDIYVFASGGYELGAIRQAHEFTRLESFLFLQDSVVLKSHEWLKDLSWRQSIALCGCPATYGSFLGIYQRRYLDIVGTPLTRTKREAVDRERDWTEAYIRAAGNVPVLFNDLADNESREIRHGREVMRIENEFLVKFKSCWSVAMIPEYEALHA